MNNKYMSKKINYDFATLKNENNYCCTTGCTCKYLNSRTDFDKQQQLRFQQLNNVDYGQKMFQPIKKKFY